MESTVRWNPDRYLAFADYRRRPAIDLLQQVPLEAPGTVVDLGCGAGDVTRIMADFWPSADVAGVDSSPDMLAKAHARGGEVRWIEGDIESWSPAVPVDLLYTNAALHWVDDHAALLPRLAGYLAPGGCLAVQMPLSWDLPSHRLLRETLADGGEGGRPLGSEALRRAMGRRWVQSPRWYHDLLAPHVRSLDIWVTEYQQWLEGANPVLAWVSGTTLRPVLTGLTEPERARFLAAYEARLREAYPPAPDGRTHYPFPRLFFVALA